MFRLLLLACLGACGFTARGVGTDGRAIDAPLDAAPLIDAAAQTDASSVDAAAGVACFGTGLVVECVAGPPTTAVDLASQTIDTNTSPLCATVVGGGNTDACVIAGSTIHVLTGASVAAVGTRPLVLIAQTAIVIDGKIDVASHSPNIRGAASDPTTCTAGTAATYSNSGGGGYGGTFGGCGGNGRNGEAGAGGVSPTVAASPTTLRGGCPGSAGGVSPNTLGHGGGAVYLIAKGSIAIAGSVNASGASGDGGSNGDNGGGGGGSGGMIGLDAPAISVSGFVFANGGGGGEGGGGGTGNAGGESVGGAAAAGGTGGATNGGAGGAGSVTSTLTGSPGANDANPGGGGGGGGGGGAGVIKVRGTLSGVTSPPPS